MQIVIIGTGNVATILGKKCLLAGHHISQVIGRDAAKAQALATGWEQFEYLRASINSATEKKRSPIQAIHSFNAIDRNADVYIIAVTDTAIPLIAAELQLPGKLVLHTAGAVAAEAIKPITERYGVLYPLQSIRKEVDILPEIPLLIEAALEADTKLLEAFARTLSENVVRAGEQERGKLHIAAVIANNFSNHLFALTEQYCIEEKIDFHLLYPLLAAATERLQHLSPQQTQTGPAIRHDRSTIEKHLALLQAHPHLQKIYQFMTLSIQQSFPS